MSTIQILTPTEIRNYETPPNFDSFQRKKFFTLPMGLSKESQDLRTSSGKIAFVLQVGYFRSTRRFFGSQFYQSDIAFVTATFVFTNPHFSGNPKTNFGKTSPNHRRFLRFCNLSKIDKEQMVAETAESFRKEDLIFTNLLH